MGWRFRKRAKILPGVYLNFSMSGISTTIGPKGLNVNIGNKGAYLNTGIPGTGFYNRTKITNSQSTANDIDTYPPSPQVYNPPVVEKSTSIESLEIESITSPGLSALKNTLLEAYEEKEIISNEIEKTIYGINLSKKVLIISYILLIGFFTKRFKNNYLHKTEVLKELQEQLKQCVVDIDINFPEEFQQRYQELVESYKTLISSERIWDITTSTALSAGDRSGAGASVIRKPVKFVFGEINIISTKYAAFHLQNANGGDLYIYPGFVLIIDSMKKIGLIDLKDLKIKFLRQKFIESETVPTDTKILEYTWAKVNKNGTPDQRYKDNYQIPIVQYGKIHLSSETGLNEEYQISNYEQTEKFVNALYAYQALLK